MVRALALVTGLGFLSASNDGTVRLWELGGSCLSVFQVHALPATSSPLARARARARASASARDAHAHMHSQGEPIAHTCCSAQPTHRPPSC